MAFDPVDYYHLASWLYKEESQFEEARYRAIISKAYYGAFLEARNKAGVTKKSSDVHREVHNHYQKRNLAIANRLDELRVKRNEADYDTLNSICLRDSGRALSIAQQILKDIGVNC